MKKNDVKIGQAYMIKVNNSVVPVRIDAENPRGGWDGKSLVSGTKVRIKTAQRLRRKCTQADLAGVKRPVPKKRTAATGANTPPRAATVAKVAGKTTTKAKDKSAATRAKQGAKAAKTKRISGLTAAFMVLVDADAELNVKAIIQIAAEKGWWKSEAATPAATVYAAIIREISTKGDKSRFERGAKRGTFRALCTPAQKRELFGTKK